MWRRLVPSLLMAVLASACQAEAPRDPGLAAPPSSAPAVTPDPDPSPEPTRHDDPFVVPRPAWLGERVLDRGDGIFAEALPTPPVLRNRRFATIDILPPPKSRRFAARIVPVPDDVLARSSWRPECPVAPTELAYITMPFWGFDRELHTGEMLVNASVADDVAAAFRELHRVRFPIEEMRVATLKEMREWERRPTGDTNLTSSFECRAATGGSDWSQHAYGLALDINPFHNPYYRVNEVGPELATAYTDRDWKRPGMIFEGDAVTRAFDAIGWGWGGRWSSLKDWMHFSLYGN